MARFARLRWIPMLFKAYHQAQLQLDAASSKETSVSTPTALKENEALSLSTKSPHTRSHVRTRPRKNKGRLRLTQNTLPKMTKVPSKANGKLLREIQSTNRKLERLSDIQEQLKILDASLQDCNRQINELKALKEQLKEGTTKVEKREFPTMWP